SHYAKGQGYRATEGCKEQAAAVRRTLAARLGANVDEIDLFSGTTDALNIIGPSVRWRAGDEIVIAADEFPSVRLAWQPAVDAGAILRLLPISDEATREETLLAAVSEDRKSVV